MSHIYKYSNKILLKLSLPVLQLLLLRNKEIISWKIYAIIMAEANSIRLFTMGLSQNLYPVGVSLTSLMPVITTNAKIVGEIQNQKLFFFIYID
jgi:hypothetical protein